MNEILLSSLVDKVDAQDRKIEELNKKMDQIPPFEEVLNKFNTGIEGVRTDVQKISFPEKEMLELSGRLVTGIQSLKHPAERKIIHHHRVRKITWIAAALLILLCLVSSAFFTTYNKLELYKASDTKYRYLKLESNSSLSKHLGFIDSLYEANTKMREFVVAKEEQNQRDFEMMQKAAQMEKDARELKKKVARKEK